MPFVFLILFDTREIIKSKTLKLTGRKKADVTNSDVIVCWIL
jgi:hypothetical protein